MQAGMNRQHRRRAAGHRFNRCHPEWFPLTRSTITTPLAFAQMEAPPFCYVCSGSNPMGLALRYSAEPDDSVSATYVGNAALEGYPGLLHAD
jgi:hypothetical protein